MRFILIFLLAASPEAFGQTAAGGIRGVICDASWTSIQGAAVEAKNAQTGMAYSVISAGSGSYAIPNLPPGRYNVTVTVRGMKTYVHSSVLVQPGAFVQEDVGLEASEPFVVHRGRDFYDLDAELAFTAPALILNDSRLELSQDLALVKGKIVWVYIPDRGRYLLSLAPRAELGFQFGGEVSGAALKFRAGRDGIQVKSSDRIVAGSATYNIYVLSQPGWLPAKETGRSTALLGSEDRDESLLK